MNNKNIFLGLSEENLKKRKKFKQPKFIKPMLCTLTSNYFSSNKWIYEHKFDGERCIAFKNNGKVRLISRNNLLMNDKYPELAKALTQQKGDNFIIDGEIIALGKGFESLQGRINLKNPADIKIQEKKVPIAYCIFDVIYADNYDLRNLPLYSRKEVLQRLLNFNKILVYTKHRSGNGLKFFKEACAKKWEGLIAKRFDSNYQGKRSLDWLKFKCIEKQELVIAGYTEPQHSREYFGALLVGYYQNKKLMYAGKVGTGFTEQILQMLGKKMKKLEIKKCPFANYNESTNGVHWVKPQIVAEFKFAEWTKAGKLRAPRYKGLRDDKAAKDVVKEIPKEVVPKEK